MLLSHIVPYWRRTKTTAKPRSRRPLSTLSLKPGPKRIRALAIQFGTRTGQTDPKLALLSANLHEWSGPPEPKVRGSNLLWRAKKALKRKLRGFLRIWDANPVRPLPLTPIHTRLRPLVHELLSGDCRDYTVRRSDDSLFRMRTQQVPHGEYPWNGRLHLAVDTQATRRG